MYNFGFGAKLLHELVHIIPYIDPYGNVKNKTQGGRVHEKLTE